MLFLTNTFTFNILVEKVIFFVLSCKQEDINKFILVWLFPYYWERENLLLSVILIWNFFIYFLSFINLVVDTNKTLMCCFIIILLEKTLYVDFYRVEHKKTVINFLKCIFICGFYVLLYIFSQFYVCVFLFLYKIQISGVENCNFMCKFVY